MNMICVQPSWISSLPNQNQDKIHKTRSLSSLSIMEKSHKNDSVLEWIVTHTESGETAPNSYQENLKENETSQSEETQWFSSSDNVSFHLPSTCNNSDDDDVFDYNSRKSSFASTTSSSSRKSQHKLKTIINWVQKNGRRASVKCKTLKRKSSFPLADTSKQHCSEPERKSLGDVIRDKDHLRGFREFLVKEMSVENLEFWLEVEAFRKSKPSRRRKISQRIFDTYIAPLSINEINIDSKTRKQIQENLQSSDSTIFDSAQAHIFQLMERDSFRRFSNSAKQTSRA